MPLVLLLLLPAGSSACGATAAGSSGTGQTHVSLFLAVASALEADVQARALTAPPLAQHGAVVRAEHASARELAVVFDAPRPLGGHLAPRALLL